MWPAPRGDPVNLARVADVAASLQAAVEPSFGPLARASHDDDDDAMATTAKESGADVLESTAESSRGPIAALIARVARQHADKCGDGSRTMLAMVAAGLRRAAEACGDGPPSSSSSHGTVVASERRAKLVDALARLSRGDAGPALLFETLARVALEVPAPLHGRWATETTQLCGITRAASSPTSRFGWDEDDAFRAAVTSIAGTLMTGAAVSRAHRERLTLIVTSLVANTLRAASEREHEGRDRGGVERLEDHAAFVSRTLSALAANPPVLASADPRGPGVVGSVVVEGLLARVHTWRTRGVTGLDEPCKVVVLFRTEPASDDVVEGSIGVRMSDGAVVTPAGAREHAEMELDGWRRERILERSRILATRGVKLVLCTERVCDETASIFAERGVMTAEGLTERDAVRLCDVLGIHPVTSALPRVLNTCDVGEIEGFSAQKIGGDTYAYLQTPFAYTAIVTGIGVEECEGHKTLVGRALSAVAAASHPCQHPVLESNGEVRVESRGSLTLVPGAGAADACLYSAVKDQLDDFRMWAASERNAGGGVSKTNTSGDGSHPGVEAATAAWEVLLAMARAGPAMLARAVTSHPKPPNPSTKNDEFTKNASSFGSLDVVRLWTPVDGPGESTHAGSHSRTHHSHSHVAARRTMDLLAANASAMRLDPVTSVGLLVPGASVEATVPGTRSAMVHHPRVADSIVTAIETGERRYTDVPTVCDAGEAAVFEPLAGKYAALLGALDLTRQLARIDRVCSVKPGVSLSSLAAVNRLGRTGRDDESDDTDGDTDGSSSYAEDGDDTDLDDLV